MHVIANVKMDRLLTKALGPWNKMNYQSIDGVSKYYHKFLLYLFTCDQNPVQLKGYTDYETLMDETDSLNNDISKII